MKTPNERTLDTYNARAQQYILHTPSEISPGLKVWYRDVLTNVPKTATIFEIGSGSGRDALFIESLGYAVTRTDAADTFVTILSDTGVKAIKFNAINEPFPSDLDIVIANAVLVHFGREEALGVMRKVYSALVSGGKFALTLMEGDGEHVSDENDAKVGAPRYFCFWSKDAVETALRDAGFRSVVVERAKRDTWLNVIAVK